MPTEVYICYCCWLKQKIARNAFLSKFTNVNPIMTKIAPITPIDDGTSPLIRKSETIAKGIVIDMPTVATVGEVSTTARAQR